MLVWRGERATEAWPQRACASALKITRRFPLPDLRGRQGRIPPHTPARRGRGARGAWRLSLANRAPKQLRRAQFAAATAAAAQLHPDPSPRNQSVRLSPSCSSSRVGLQAMRVLRWCSCSSDSTWKPVAPLASRPKSPSTPSSGFSRADALAPLPGFGCSCSWAVSVPPPPPKMAHPQLAAAASARPEPSRLLSFPIRPIRIGRPAAAPPRRSHPLYKRG